MKHYQKREGVKKKLLDCTLEEEADEYLEEFRSAFSKCMVSNLKILDTEKRSKMPTIKEIKRKVVARLLQNSKQPEESKEQRDAY